VVERLEELLIARQAAGIVHDHGLTHREREQQHGHDGRHDAGPAEADVIRVGLVAGRKAAAGVRGKQHRTDREGGKKRGLGYGSGLGLGFHDSFLLQNDLMVWQEKRKPSVFPALWQKRRKAENPPRYHSSSPPNQGTHSHGIPSYPCTITGAPVCTYSSFSAAAVQPVRQVCTLCASHHPALL